MIKNFKKFECYIENNICHIILCDLPNNLMDTVFFEELNYINKNIVSKNKLAGIIIYSKGRHFSAGANLGELFSNIKKDTRIDNGKIIKFPEFLFENNKTFLFYRKLNIPIVAAISGVCLGSALEFALFCDYRICSNNAILGLPESTFNIFPGCGGITNLYNLVGCGKALELILTGKNFKADEALEHHIIHKIVDKKNLVSSAIEKIIEINDKINKLNNF